MRYILALGSFWIVGAIGLVMFTRLRRYRIDLAPGQDAYDGASKIGQVNYMSRGNYSASGQRLLRLFWGWHVLMLATICLAMWLVAAEP